MIWLSSISYAFGSYSPRQLWLEILPFPHKWFFSHSKLKMTSALGTWHPDDRKQQNPFTFQKVHGEQKYILNVQKRLLRTWNKIRTKLSHFRCPTVFGSPTYLRNTKFQKFHYGKKRYTQLGTALPSRAVLTHWDQRQNVFQHYIPV